MVFKHVPKFPLANLTAKTDENGRFYTTPEGNVYPSVTTVLGAGSDNTWLDKWKNRVGEDEVKRISGQAANRGTAVHDIAEKYLLNEKFYTKGHMPANIFSFNQIKPLLDQNVGLIAGLELPLYSDKLRVAGRSDCIGKWAGSWSIIDFKTSKRVKKKEDIENYFLQESCYAEMFFERVGFKIPQLVTVMMVDDSEPLVFVEKTEDWIEKFIDLREKVSL